MTDVADFPGVPQDQRHRIKHRFFGRPEFKFRQGQGESFRRRFAGGQTVAAQFKGHIFFAGKFGLRPDRTVFRIGSQNTIRNMTRIQRHQFDLPENTAEPPAVLILQIAPGTVFIDLQSNAVFARRQQIGNIKFRNGGGILRVARKSAVDPDPERTLNAARAEKDALSGPVRRQPEDAPTGSRGIPFFETGIIFRRHTGNLRGIHPEGPAFVPIKRRAVSLHLEGGGQRDFSPVRVIKVRHFKAVREMFQIRRPVKEPFPVEGERVVLDFGEIPLRKRQTCGTACGKVGRQLMECPDREIIQ